MKGQTSSKKLSDVKSPYPDTLLYRHPDPHQGVHTQMTKHIYLHYMTHQHILIPTIFMEPFLCKKQTNKQTNKQANKHKEQTSKQA